MSLIKTFRTKKYASMLFPCALGLFSEIITPIAATFLAGRFFGEDGISAVNVISPLFFLGGGIATIFGIGTSFSVNEAIGAFEEKRANRLFGEGLLYALIAGVVVFVLATFGQEFYLDYIGVSGVVREYAREYLALMRFGFLTSPVAYVLFEIALIEGDSRISSFTTVAMCFMQTLGAYFFALLFGMRGLGLAATLSGLVTLLVPLFHFRKHSSLKPVPTFSLKDFWMIVRYSITDAADRICLTITGAALDRIVVQSYGEEMLPVLSVITTVVDCTLLFDTFGYAFLSPMGIYYGSGNSHSIRKLFRVSLMNALVTGAVFAAGTFFFAKQIPALFGMTDEALILLSARALRILALNMIFVAMHYAITSLYLVVDRIAFSTTEIVLYDTVLMIPLVLLLKNIGIEGICWSYFASAVLSILLVNLWAFFYTRKHKDISYPLLIPKQKTLRITYDRIVTRDAILTLKNKVYDRMREAGVEESCANKVALLTEEFGLYIHEQNCRGNQSVGTTCGKIHGGDQGTGPACDKLRSSDQRNEATCEKRSEKRRNSKKIYSEWDYEILPDSVRIVVQDTGVLFDLMKEDETIGSFRDYVLLRITKEQVKGRYVLTMSANRHSFEIPRRPAESVIQ